MEERRSFRFHGLPLLLRRLFPAPRNHGIGPVKSVVCLRPGKIGDLLVATPLFSALKKHGGVERIAIICSPGNEVAVRCNPYIDERRAINFHRVPAVLGAIGWMRSRKFDAVIDLTPGFSRTNFLMSQGAGGRTVRVGIEKERLADRYHVHVERPGTPLADRFLAAGEALTGRSFPPERSLEIYSSAQERAEAVAFINATGGDGRLVAVNLSSATERRQWSFENFDRLLGLLASSNREIRPVLIGVGEQRRWALELAQRHRACIAAPEGSFLTAVEIIAACRMLISTDTALVHAAAARSVPLVAIYVEGGENYARWQPYRGHGIVIQARPGQGVNEIPPEAVCTSVLDVLASDGEKALQVISFAEEKRFS